MPVEYEAESSKVQNAILRALSDAEKQHIVGAAITPFLLSKVVQYTDGNALQTNQRLAENNAATAAQIAVAFSTGTAHVYHVACTLNHSCSVGTIFASTRT